MKADSTVSIIACHAEGEVGDVIIGGIADMPASTMHEKLLKFTEKYDGLRKILHNEPRGRLEMSTMIITAPCDPRADAGFLIMSADDWVPMSGSNTICTATVLLEKGILPITGPTTVLKLDTAAGLITVTAECRNGSCKSVSFDNVPAFVYALDHEIEVPGVGKVLVDIAYGGQWYAVVRAADLGVMLDTSLGSSLIALGIAVKKAVLDSCMPEHPENPLIRGINNVIITNPLLTEVDAHGSSNISVKHAVIVTPGRLDRSPCGTGSSSRLAIMHARKQVRVGQSVTFSSIIDSQFVGTVKATTKVGSLDAIVPTTKGRAWITGTKQLYLDPDDPYPEGYRL
ncbi:hypothetical protein NLU13_6678 [Sarocladium strictum]|uniref:Proline racemase n=1 Tax=Sarocladium strictum TaxID=5046 RepID=A0AA39L354_SARSR|nr:hypothetical protein NLU13_9777 [Sarocladium strictum]KAK0385498.1 hypothetical protein NLU13_6678 [Sarocladium strictum]